MKTNLLLLVFVCLIKFSFCQNQAGIDSLANSIKILKDDTAKVNTLMALSRQLSGNGYFDEAIQRINEALALSEKLNFKRGVANSQNTMGIVYSDDAIYSEALKHYLIALHLREEMGDRRSMSSSYINIGNAYIQQSNYPEALKNYFAGLEIGEQLNDEALEANAYGSIANVYAEQGNNDEALKNDFIALNIRMKIGDGHGVILSHINIADVYMQQGNYKEALKNYSDVIEQGKVHGYSRTLSYAYVRTGNIYFLEGNNSEALKNYLLGLEIDKQLGDKYEMANSTIYLGKVYTKMNMPDKAEGYLSQGLQLSKENKSKTQVKDAYAALSKLDSTRGDISGAFKYYLLYTAMKDSIFNEKSDKQISQLKIQYETDKKDQEIKTQKLQLLNQILQNRILQILIVISLLVIIFLFYLFRMRNRRKKKEYDHMRTDLELTILKAQLNPHFISNSLSAIKSFIEQQPERAAQYLSKIARLMRRVLEQNEQTIITLEEELQTVELYMQIEVLRLEYGFDFHFEVDDSVNPKLVMVPPLILQPIVENAIWHGLASKNERGYVVIRAKIEDELLKFTVEDNGEGQQPAAEVGNVNSFERKSYGLSITRKRIEVLSKELKRKGYLNLEFLPGKTVVEIAMPVSYH